VRERGGGERRERRESREKRERRARRRAEVEDEEFFSYLQKNLRSRNVIEYPKIS
jgi:hypothetical protein